MYNMLLRIHLDVGLCFELTPRRIADSLPESNQLTFTFQSLDELDTTIGWIVFIVGVCPVSCL